MVVTRRSASNAKAAKSVETRATPAETVVEDAVEEAPSAKSKSEPQIVTADVEPDVKSESLAEGDDSAVDSGQYLSETKQVDDDDGPEGDDEPEVVADTAETMVETVAETTAETMGETMAESAETNEDSAAVKSDADAVDNESDEEPAGDEPAEEQAARKRRVRKKKKPTHKRLNRAVKQAEEEARKREKTVQERLAKVRQYQDGGVSIEDQVEITYTSEELEIDSKDPNYDYFASIFDRFKLDSDASDDKAELTKGDAADVKAEKTAPAIDATSTLRKEKMMALLQGGDVMNDDVEDSKPKLSKKKIRAMNRLTVSELKQLVSKPELVELHDPNSTDPRLLLLLKSTRNAVPVPRHWTHKRRFLAGKRGYEKPPFRLPDFIKATGIMEMREALQEKEQVKSLKSRMRETARPRLGKIDIDYQKLHDAFFRWQVKPRLTCHGDLYYEGKEFESTMKDKKAGMLSDDLRIALGMPVGANADKFPPPWLIAMQRYGPPPSYPALRIPGLNAPIPEGCTFGYHVGGWGKPPVDELGRPLYGDVFGPQGTYNAYYTQQSDVGVDRTHWGELESESESESESEGEDQAGQEDAVGMASAAAAADSSRPPSAAVDKSGMVTPIEGLTTPSGTSSSVPGLETPETIELRKRSERDTETPLYAVLPERKTAVGGSLMGSSHVYDLAAAGKKFAAPGGSAEGSGERGVEITLAPEELDMDTRAMQVKYEAKLRERDSQLAKEDFSDMVADHVAKTQRKRKAKEQAEQNKTGAGGKKYREFKF